MQSLVLRRSEAPRFAGVPRTGVRGVSGGRPERSPRRDAGQAQCRGAFPSGAVVTLGNRRGQIVGSFRLLSLSGEFSSKLPGPTNASSQSEGRVAPKGTS